jgi:hypothetical protein
MEEIKNIKNTIATPLLQTFESIFYSNTIKMGFSFILLFLSFMYLKKRYKTNCESLKNKYYQDTNEIITGVNYLLYHPSKIRYIFWTGGYSSTFLLIQALIIEAYPVQPIYIKCQTIDTNFSIERKCSQKKEMEVMSRIRTKILTDFPHLKPMFLPTMYVYSIEKDLEISNKFRELYKSFALFDPDISQYERLARFSIGFSKQIEIGVVKNGIGLDYATSGIRINEGSKECQVNLNELEKLNKHPNNNNPVKDYKNLEIFKNIKFTVIHMNKEEIKRLVSRQKILYLLQMTWTCWFPTKDGKSCNKCHQCAKKMDLNGFINN